MARPANVARQLLARVRPLGQRPQDARRPRRRARRSRRSARGRRTACPPPRSDDVRARPMRSLSALGLEPRHVERHRHEQMRARAQRLGGLVGRRRSISSATTQTSPTLLRLPAALRIRAVDVRREQPSCRPACRQTACRRRRTWRCIPRSTTSRSTRPRFRSSAVSGLPSGPLLMPIASNCCSCFGKDVAADARHAGLRQHLDAVDLVVDDERRRLDRAGHRQVPRADRRARRDVDLDGDLVRASR